MRSVLIAAIQFSELFFFLFGCLFIVSIVCVDRRVSDWALSTKVFTTVLFMNIG